MSRMDPYGLGDQSFMGQQRADDFANAGVVIEEEDGTTYGYNYDPVPQGPHFDTPTDAGYFGQFDEDADMFNENGKRPLEDYDGQPFQPLPNLPEGGDTYPTHYPTAWAPYNDTTGDISTSVLDDLWHHMQGYDPNGEIPPPIGPDWDWMYPWVDPNGNQELVPWVNDQQIVPYQPPEDQAMVPWEDPNLNDLNMFPDNWMEQGWENPPPFNPAWQHVDTQDAIDAMNSWMNLQPNAGNYNPISVNDYWQDEAIDAGAPPIPVPQGQQTGTWFDGFPNGKS